MKLPFVSLHPFRLALAALCAVLVAASAQAETKIKVLIVDGQNNHQWPITSPMLKQLLETTGRFSVDVTTAPPSAPAAPKMAKEATPAQKTAHAESLTKHAAAVAAHKAAVPTLWAKWRPNFSAYAVIVSNYNGERWPAEVDAAFLAFVKNGGGFVSYHAANNSFADWPEYNAMIGLGGWGGRNEKSGPYLRLRQTVWTKDPTPGPGGGHGPQHEFLIESHVTDHPILRGLPAKWMHAKDELYHVLRGPAANVTVLASALSDKTKEQEPMLMVIPYGQGRVFHTTLGHSVDAVNGLGFQVTLARGTEWAATGQVSLPAPPAAELPTDRPGLRVIRTP